MIRTRGLRYQPPAGAQAVFADVDLPAGGMLMLQGPPAHTGIWLALVAGLLAPASGELQVAGTAPAALAPPALAEWRRKTVGLWTRQPQLNPALSVQANLTLPFFAAGLPVDRWALAHAMAAAGTEGWAGNPASQLSDAQARRVALARALLLAPPLLLIDHALDGLDAEAAQPLLAALRNWQAEKGCTLVLAGAATAVREAFPQAQALAPGAATQPVEAAAP